jgi:hypothetical protein
MNTFVCIATGPSLTSHQIDYLKGKPVKTMVVNDSYQMLPDADYMYACDNRWWELHIAAVKKTFTGECWTQCKKASANYKLKHITGKHREGLGKDIIHYGRNSGYQAINLSYLLGAKKIILLGYDMQRTNNKSHWFGDHPGKLNTNTDYATFVPAFTRLNEDLKKEGIEVINCTPSSAIECFKKEKLEDVL